MLVHGLYADGSSWAKVIPLLQAKRIGATTIELKSSHVSMLSHPREIADLILQAANVR